MGTLSLWKRKGSLTLGTPSPAGRSTGTYRELHRLRAECNPWLVAGRTERDQHRRSWLPCCTSQPETHTYYCTGGLGAETWASVDRPRERTGVGCSETAQRAWSVVWATSGCVCRMEPRSTTEAPLSTCVKSEVWPHHSSLILGVLTVAVAPHYQLWEHTGTSRLPTHRGRTGIWANSWWLCELMPSADLWAQCVRDIRADYWHSRGWGVTGISSCRLCGCMHMEAGLGSGLIPLAPMAGLGVRL